MKKTKSSNDDMSAILDKNYKATLLLVKLVSSLSLELHELNSKFEEQNALIKRLSGTQLEEEAV